VLTDLLTVVLVILGCAFTSAGTLGLLRFGDRTSRLHALTKADNVGLALLAAGLALQATPGTAAKLALIWVLALVAAAVAGPLLAREGGERPVVAERDG
jgi:multicomponent Na+:H+ antiporter subunit G